MRFYYLAQPPELINFSKLAKEFPSETAYSLLVLLLLCKPLDVIMVNVVATTIQECLILSYLKLNTI